MSRSNPPSREEILGYFSELSNWVAGATRTSSGPST